MKLDFVAKGRPQTTVTTKGMPGLLPSELSTPPPDAIGPESPELCCHTLPNAVHNTRKILMKLHGNADSPSE